MRPFESGLAKRMARDSFRNTKKLEDVQAVGRISQDEMKALIVEVVVPELQEESSCTAWIAARKRHACAGLRRCGMQSVALWS